MSQAIVDPEQLRRFATNLKRFNGELQGQLQSLHGQLKNLGQSWRDKEHQKFAEEFDQTMVAVAKFVEAVDEHVPFLLRKADRVEEYLRQR
ncbi:MAG TPA: WXG100 family type VII secretion target [Pirellulales bacterium]|jgi:WXG100 family type VII secretion target